MCCITFVRQESTMATTQLMRAANYVVRWQGQEEARTEFKPPRMNWVVVTDKNHNRHMQMHWEPSAGNR